MPATIAAPPDLTARFNAVIGRLAHAPIGVFTLSEFNALIWAFDIAEQMAQSSHRQYRIYRSANAEGEPLMREYRDTHHEIARLEFLEAMAEKAGA